MNSKLSDQTAGYLDRYRHHTGFTLVGPLVAQGRQYCDPVIFVDGGSIRREGDTGIAVGDGDSSADPMDVALDPAKDFSDLSFALRLLPDAVTTVSLDGFLGGRRDHELFNFGEVHSFLAARSAPASAHFEQAVVAVSAGHWQLEVNGLFSLMAIEPARVLLHGDCEYPIEPATEVKPLSSFGLSNIGQGVISIQCNRPIFVLSDHISGVQPEEATHSS